MPLMPACDCSRISLEPDGIGGTPGFRAPELFKDASMSMWLTCVSVASNQSFPSLTHPASMRVDFNPLLWLLLLSLSSSFSSELGEYNKSGNIDGTKVDVWACAVTLLKLLWNDST